MERGPDGRWMARGLKVDGQETEESLTDDELRRTLQERSAGQKRMKEVALEKQRLQQVFGMLKSDPIGALSQLGIDTDAALTQYVARQAQLAALSPEQREVVATKQQMAALQAQQKQMQSQLEEAAIEQQWQAQWQPELRAAFEEVGWGDDAESNLIALAELGERYTQAGIDLAPRQLVRLVDNETANTATKYAARAPTAKAQAIVSAALPRISDETLEAVLGPRLEALIQRRVAAIKAKRSNGSAPTLTSAPAPVREKPSMLTPEEWRKSFLSQK